MPIYSKEDARNGEGDPSLLADKSQRRRFLSLTASALGALALPRELMASAVTTFNVTSYGASPTLSDNSAAFAAAITALEVAGGGTLQVPAGKYQFASSAALVCTGVSITIIGDGSALSILSVPGLTGTFLTLNTNQNQLVTMQDIGFTSTGGAGSALTLNFAGGLSNSPSCWINRVDFGSGFNLALNIINAQRSVVQNCSFNGPGSFIQVGASGSGYSLDTRFQNCTAGNVSNGFLFVGGGLGIQGMHIVDCVISGNLGVCTGISSNAPSGAANTNVLGLFITGCQFSCSYYCLYLYQVTNGWISDCNLNTTSATSYTTVAYLGCVNVQMTNSQISGSFPASGATTACTGVVLTNSVNSSNPNLSCNDNQFDNVTFSYLSTGFSLQSAYNTTAGNIQMIFPGNIFSGSNILVGAPTTEPGSTVPIQVAVDTSGNTTNQVQWLGSSGGTHHLNYLR